MPKQIDHINHNVSDNRICNLRETCQRINTMNSSLRKDNKSGVSGVTWDKRTKTWEVKISINKKRKSLGYFKNKEDAIQVRKDAEILYGYHENHGKTKEELENE